MSRIALLLALLLAAAAAAQDAIRIGPDPIPGLELTPGQNATLEMLPGTSLDAAFTLRNAGTASLDLRITTFEFSGPNANRTLILQADRDAVTLAPGESARVVVNVTVSPDAPGGRERRFAFLAEAPAQRRMTDALTTVRFGGPPCVECPPEDEGPGGVFESPDGPGPGVGPGLVRRPLNATPRDDNASAAQEDDADPYAETPGFAAWAVGLAALAAALGRRRG
jgi:MYXO-CTERM domain-containing protein